MQELYSATFNIAIVYRLLQVQKRGSMSKKESIYIIGGGIIGCTTAFYLTDHPKFDTSKYEIVIIESNDIACAASGKAGGLLASWAFPTKLAELSFRLHQCLAQKYQGDLNWDYRHLPSVNLDVDLTHENDEDTNHNSLPTNLNWIDSKNIIKWTKLSDKDSTAQIHPYKFTNFILQKAIDSHCVKIIHGKVTNINIDNTLTTTCLKSLEYIPMNKGKPDQKKSTEIKLTPNDKVIVCTGPWISRLLPQCPISGMKAHSITVQPNVVVEEGQYIEPYALFNEIKLTDTEIFTPEIYSRKEDIYICGETDKMNAKLPDPTKDVEVNPTECDKLYKYASILSPDQIGHGQILKRQACYLPVLNDATSCGPLIGETDVPSLYMASGHACWGINNSCATGKLLSELILDGEVTSCDIDKLNPQLYFDVS